MVTTTLKPGEKEIRAITDLTMRYDARMKRSRIIYTVLGIASLGFVALSKYWDMKVSMIIFALIGSFAIFMAVAGLKSLFEKAMWKFESTKVERTYTILDEGITVDSELGLGKYGWDTFLGWGNIRNFIFLLVNSRQVILIDKENLNEKELEEVEQKLSRNVRFIA